MIDHAAASDLLEAYGEAWRTFGGDAWVALYTEDAEYHVDPFAPPLVGHNALRAYILDCATKERDVQFTVERHWVSGETVLAMWHASVLSTSDGRPIRSAGFMTAEIAPDGRIARFREWSIRAPGSAG